MEEGYSQVFVKDLELTLARNMRADKLQAFKEVNKSQRFGKKNKTISFLFWMSRFQVPQGMFVQRFAQIFEDVTAWDQY